MIEGPLSLLSRTQLMIGVTLQSWNPKNVDLHWGTDWEVKHLSTKDYWTESCWETQTTVWTISKDSCDRIWPREPKTVFLYRFMQLMKYNGGTMDLHKRMTRFQLTGNRLIESWTDLLPDLETTSPKAIAHVAWCRLEHEARQANLAGIAAATPGQGPHVNVPWTDEHALAAFRQLNTDRRTQQRLAFPLGDNLSAWQLWRKIRGTHSQVSWHIVEEN